MRISIGGGGTDLPSFYSKYKSYFISGAIDKYIYIMVQERKYYDEYLLKYSKVETVKDVAKIKNEIIRECLKFLKINNPLEIVSFSDIGGETGLGSSGAFCVGLLNALHTYKKEVVNQGQIAEEACYIAMKILSFPSGKQDEYITAYGGLTSFNINKKGDVSVNPNEFDQDFTRELEHYLYMFYTGIRRKSKEILQIQKEATEKRQTSIINNLRETQQLGYEIKDALKKEDAFRFGQLLDKHWKLKRKRSKTTSEKIDKWYKIARKSGAVGGKIMGAGGGGFFLFYCDKNAPQMIRTLQKNGLTHIPFNFDHQGTKIIANL